MSFPEPGAVWRPAATTERAVTSPTGSWTRFAAPGAEVGGGFGLFESWIPADSPGALPHLHTGFTESFYVLDGALRVMTGDTWTEAGPGDLVHVPHRGVHAFRTGPDSDARFLILFVPGAPRERYFRGLAEFAARATPPSAEEVDAFALTCDQVNLRDHPGFTTPLS
ncbi:cupin domain-containing protein [Pseudonocardia sp. DR1-2]|nr:cupin domain-containing protein [Pseudonocardia sp. DR1-2]MCM3846975.1 cupin domain-containing protein [Pseudonocardia sp. DR1-2]